MRSTDLNSTVYVDPSHDIPLVSSPVNFQTIADLDTNEGWEMLGGGFSKSTGVRVNVEKAIGVAAVWQAVSMISGDIAKLPLDIWRRKSDDSREKDRTHVAYRAVRREASPGVHAHKFWRRMMVFALLYNNAYAFISRTQNGRGIRLTPLLPDRTQAVKDGSGQLLYQTDVDGETRAFFPSQILHIEGICLDGLQGFEFIRAARETLALAISATNYAGQFYRNGGRIGGILEVPLGMTKKSSDNLVEGFQRTYEDAEKAFKTVILRDGSKFHPGQLRPRDTQMIDTRREAVKDVARLFSLHPGKLGEESSRTYNNKGEENRDYIDTTLSNWLMPIASECDLKLLTPKQRDNDSHYFEHNTDAFLRADIETRYKVYQIAKQGRIMTTNEIRVRENLPKIDGGDELENPNIDPAPAREVAQTHRALLDKAVQNTMAIVVKRAMKATSSGKDFLQWLDQNHVRDFGKVTSAVRPILDAYASAVGGDGAALTAYAMQELTSDLHDRLSDVADTTHADELNERVGESLEGYPEMAASQVSNLIFGDQP